MRAEDRQKPPRKPTAEYRAKVPCVLSSSGTHWVTVTVSGSHLLSLRGECSGAAADAVDRLGGETCRAVVLSMQEEFKNEATAHFSAPEPLASVMRQIARNARNYVRRIENEEKPPGQVIKRLGTKWASRVAGFPLAVRYGLPFPYQHGKYEWETMFLSFVTEDGRRRDGDSLAHKENGQWIFNELHILESAEGKATFENRCLACRKDFPERIRAHARTRKHREAVLMGVRRAIAVLRGRTKGRLPW